MVKWVSEKKGGVGENGNAVTCSTFDDEDRRFKANDEDFMTSTSAYQGMLVEYEAVMKEERERGMNKQMEPYITRGVNGKVTDV